MKSVQARNMEPFISARSDQELQRALKELDITVGHRGQRGYKQRQQRFDMACLLASLPLDRFHFPLDVVDDDRPDMTLNMLGTTVGVEITEAVPTNSAHAADLRRELSGNPIYWPPRPVPGEPKRSREQLLQEIEDDRPGRPYEGDEPERIWIDAMLHVLEDKTERARKPNFRLYPQNWLLVYDAWGLPAVDVESAGAMFETRFVASDLRCTFDRVYVITSKHLCEFGNGFVMHGLRKPKTAD